MSSKLPVPPPPDKPITMAIIGAGNRAEVYASFALHCPEWLRIVAVCDPRPFRAKEIAKQHSIPPENVFIGDWSRLTAKGQKLADTVLISTPDRDHMGPAVSCARLKYHILLEKPMSVNLDECVQIYQAVVENGVFMSVGHILRYSPLMAEVKEVINSRVIGQVVSVQHLDPIGYFHFAHSFVRGNWHKESTSSFSLLTKGCHDLDMITYLIGSKCKKISSFGNLTHFRKENKPKEAGKATKCLSCAYESSCPYSAKKIYIDSFNRGNSGWPNSIVQPNGPIDIENLTAALRTTAYGTCVYELDNDVCDHQIVNMEFENGITASVTMVAFSQSICVPKTKVFGTLGELTSDGSDMIRIYDFLTRRTRIIHPSQKPSVSAASRRFPPSCHHSGDFELLQAFLYACATGNSAYILSGAKETLDSHLNVFAAEESRRTERVVLMEEYYKSALNRDRIASSLSTTDHVGGAQCLHCEQC